MSILHRPFGTTGDSLSIIGIGGVTVVGHDASASIRLFDEALDAGVNYADVAPSYGVDQETEKRFGDALVGRRSRVFLACKTGERSATGARLELERSLQHLKTDHFDLYQLHAITSVEEVERAFAPDGAMDVIINAQREGKVRHIGFSAHSVDAALRALELFPFASALFPVNFVTTYAGHFGPQIIDACLDKGASRLALKAMAMTHWKDGEHRDFPNCWYSPISDERLSELALRWTLSQDVTAAVPPGDPILFRRALTFAKRFTTISDEEVMELKQVASQQAPIFSTV
jgi:aryl-alcohol dehydrogenase-like predicted oxidoreductase